MRRVALLALLAAALVGCREKPRAEAHAAPALRPLVAEPTSTLTAHGFGDAVVVSPVGATRPMPVIVAVLGIGDTPEGQCATWRSIVEGRAFVVCPRGRPNVVQEEGAQRDEGDPQTTRAAREEVAAKTAAAGSTTKVNGFYPPDVATIEAEIDEDLRALHARFGQHVDGGPVLYAGFSRGAFLGASLVAKHPDRYPRAILIEGGQTPWTDETAGAFAAGGGKRVLFACGQPACVEESEGSAKRLAKFGVLTRVVHSEGEGHVYTKGVKDDLRRDFDWLVEGDARFRQLVAAK